jgi:hypothetical protein
MQKKNQGQEETNNNLSQKKSDETNYMKSFVWYREREKRRMARHRTEKIDDWKIVDPFVCIIRTPIHYKDQWRRLNI